MKKIFALTILVFLFLPLRLLSAESGLQLTPAANDLILKPGEAYVGTFTVRNNNEYNVTLDSQKGFLTSNGEVSLDPSKDTSTQWITTDKLTTDINSLTETTFNYSIKVPPDTQEGFYRPMLIFKLSTDQSESGSVTSLTQLLPFQFNLFVSESGAYSGNLKVNKLNVGSSILIGNEQKIDFSVGNTNVSPARPLIRIQVLSPNGEIIYQKVENENLSFISQNQEIANSLNISDSFNSESKLGRYTVELFAKDILTNKEVSAKIAFWYIPQSFVSIFIIVVILIGILIFLYYSFRKRMENRKKEDKHLFMYK